MYTQKCILPVVQIIVPFANIKIENADGVYFLHFVVAFAQRDMLGNGFGHPIENALQIIQLPRILNFYDNNFSFAVLCFNIYPIEFIIGSKLIAFAFEYFYYLDLFVQQYG